MTPTDDKSTMPKTSAERMAGGASVSKAFGEPIVAQGRTIIPVALVAMGFRGGFRGGLRGLMGLGNAPAGAPTPPTGGPAGDGPSHGGMMRRMVVRPVGYIDVSSSDSRFVTIAPGRFVALGFALAFAVGALLGGRRRMRRMNHRRNHQG